MKVVLIFLTLLSSLIIYCFASTEIGFFSDPKHPGKCAIKPDLILSPGKHQNPNDCGTIMCSENGSATFHYCGATAVDENNCSKGDYVNKTADYPECCLRYYYCKYSNGTDYVVTF